MNGKLGYKKGMSVFAAIATLTAILAIGFTPAQAYNSLTPPDSPAVQYHSWQTDEATGEFLLDEEGYLIPAEIDHGDNAWMLTSAALVLMMTPAGLAMFYGGLSRRKNAVNTS